MYGRDGAGRAIQHEVSGFRPYFFVQPRNMDEVKKVLTEFPEVTDIFEDYRFLPNGYQVEPTEVLQVYVNRPSDVPKIRDALRGHPEIVDMYEADVLYATARFLTDYDLYGMRWVEANKNDVKTVMDRSDDAPIKIMGFDIEVLPPERGVPDSSRDPIIIVSVSFNDAETVVLVARDGISTKNIRYVGSEAKLLSEFMDIVRSYDPDVVMGFNEYNFDFPLHRKTSECAGNR